MSSGNTLGSEVVEFRADGLDEIIARTADLEAAVRKAHAEQLKQLQAMASPALAKAALDLTKIKARTDDLAKAERQQREQAVRNSRLLSGEYAMQARLRDQAAKAARTAAQAERATELGQGIYAARAKATARADRRDARLALAEQRADLAAGVSLYRAKTAAAAAVQQARLGQGLRAQSLSSGLYGQQSRDAARLERTDARLGVAEKASDLRSGVTLTRMKTAAAVERADAQLALATRRLALSSGVFSQQVAARAKAEGENAALAKAERRAELQALYGRRLGGAIHAGERFAPGLATASGALAGVGAAGVGMARAGFSGTTAEMALAMEIKLLNREIAGALVPIMRDLTAGVRWVRRSLERLSPDNQKWLGRGVAGAAIVGTGGLAMAGVAAALGNIAAMLRTMGVIGGAGAVAGSAVAGAVGNAAGSAAGTLAAGAAGAAGGAAKGAGGSLLSRLRGGAGRFAAKIPFLTLAAGAITDQTEDDSFYNLHRAGGRGRVMSFIGGTINKATELTGIHSLFGTDRRAELRQEYGLPANFGQGQKTSTLIAQAGFSSFDAEYQRTAESVALMDATERETGGKLAGRSGPDPERQQQQMAEDMRRMRELMEEQRSNNRPSLR